MGILFIYLFFIFYFFMGKSLLLILDFNNFQAWCIFQTRGSYGKRMLKKMFRGSSDLWPLWMTAFLNKWNPVSPWSSVGFFNSMSITTWKLRLKSRLYCRNAIMWMVCYCPKKNNHIMASSWWVTWTWLKLKARKVALYLGYVWNEIFIA